MNEAQNNPSISMHIIVAGLRGFPGVQGGVESHASHLYPELVNLGCQVTVIARSSYQTYQEPSWKGVKFKKIWAPKSQSLEALVHSTLAVVVAAFYRPDIFHIHAVGPSLVVPLARFFRLPVVMTHHGPDYEREKWNRFARTMLEFGERLGVTYAQQRIVISNGIKELVQQKYNLESTVIPNGVELSTIRNSSNLLNKFELRPHKFILLVGRIVPEKRHLDLLDAFELSKLTDWKLVFVGASDHQSDYGRKVLARVEQTEGAISTGFLTGEDLAELYSNAGIFVLPSSHEGLPIALLEALSFGLPCIASDIAANLEVNLDPRHYFQLGSAAALAEKLRLFASTAWGATDRDQTRRSVAINYNWQSIAKKTFDVYRRLT